MGKWWKRLGFISLCTLSFMALANNNPQWIWFPDPPGVKGETRYFRTILEVNQILDSAMARIVATQETTVFLNDEQIGFIRPEEILGSIELAEYLKPGKNVLGIKIQASQDKELQPLLVKVVDLDDEIIWRSDSTWKAASYEVEDWASLACDDSNWAEVLISNDRNKPAVSAEELVAMMGQFAPKLDPDILDKASIWATHSAEYIFTDAIWGENQTVKCLSGRNQFASAQLAIRSEKDIMALELEFSDLKKQDNDDLTTLDSSHFYYNFIDTWYMPKNSTETPPTELVRQAPEHMPDILVESRLANIPKNYTKAVFLRFFIPKDTPEGIYTGTLKVKTIGAKRDIPVEIEVLPVDLPEETNLKVTMWFQPDYIVQYNNVSKYSEEFWEIIDYYGQLMAEHRQNMVWTPLGLVELSYDENDNLVGDFSKFDRWVLSFFKHGFKYIELSHIGGRVGDWNSDFGYWKRQAYSPVIKAPRDVPLADYVHLIQEHLRQKGWLEAAYIHVADEPTPANYQSWITLAKEIKKGAPELKIMEALHYTVLSEYLDVSIPQLDYFNQNKVRLRKEQEEGRIELWFYTCWLPQGNYPNRLLDYPLYKTRILHWANFIYDATGYLHWGYNWWRAFEVGYAPGDGWIVYPTAKNLVPALRYEAMREGIEDYEYFLLHTQKMQEVAKELKAPVEADARAKEIAQTVMPSLTNYTKDPLEMLTAREKLLREIVELDKGPKAIVATEITEDKTLREEVENTVEIYTEKDAKVYLNGVLLEGDSYFKAKVYLTPENYKITITVIKDDNTKIIERVYNKWRLIR